MHQLNSKTYDPILLIQAALILRLCLAVEKIAVSFFNTNLSGTEWNDILIHPVNARSYPVISIARTIEIPWTAKQLQNKISQSGVIAETGR